MQSVPSDVSQEVPGKDSGGAQQEKISNEALAVALAEAETQRNNFLRVMADLENYRRRVAKEKEDWGKAATVSAISDLLPIIDHFAIGLQSIQEHNKTTEGFKLVYEQLLKFLEARQVKTLKPEAEKFDPKQHECLAYIPHDTLPEGMIAQVVRLGYTLGDRLVRPASVIVSSGPASPEPTAEKSA